MNFFERWNALWKRLEASAPPEHVFELLESAYSGADRAYHSLAHVEECLALYDEHPELAHRPNEVELAIWFHDSVYDTHRRDNEDRSAAWARDAIGTAGLPSIVGERVAELIRATVHDAPSHGIDATFVVDVDLAILGSARGRFSEYERQIREEYAWVPDREFREGRSRVLRSIADRPRIFRLPPMFERFEARARENLASSIAGLELPPEELS